MEPNVTLSVTLRFEVLTLPETVMFEALTTSRFVIPVTVKSQSIVVLPLIVIVSEQLEPNVTLSVALRFEVLTFPVTVILVAETF